MIKTTIPSPFILTNKPSSFVNNPAFNGGNDKKRTTISNGGIGKMKDMTEKQLELTNKHFSNKRQTYS